MATEDMATEGGVVLLAVDLTGLLELEVAVSFPSNFSLSPGRLQLLPKWLLRDGTPGFPAAIQVKHP